MLPTIAWEDGEVVMIDQRKLPSREVTDCNTVDQRLSVAIPAGARAARPEDRGSGASPGPPRLRRGNAGRSRR